MFSSTVFCYVFNKYQTQHKSHCADWEKRSRVMSENCALLNGNIKASATMQEVAGWLLNRLFKNVL